MRPMRGILAGTVHAALQVFRHVQRGAQHAAASALHARSPRGLPHAPSGSILSLQALRDTCVVLQPLHFALEVSASPLSTQDMRPQQMRTYLRSPQK